MINQRNKLMTYFLPRSGRFLSVRRASFSVQRRNQVLLSALLLLSAFALMPAAFAQRATVSNLTAVTGDGTVTLSWVLATNGGTLTGYSLIVRDSRGERVTPTPPSPAIDVLTHTVTGLTNGIEYTIQLSATTTSGLGVPGEVSTTPSGTVDPSTIPPDPVTNLTVVSVGDGTVTLSWTAPVDPGGTAITSQRVFIERLTGGSSIENVPIDPTMPTRTVYTVDNLINGEIYNFSVDVTNDAGPSPDASIIATPDIPATEPGPVTNLTAVAGDGTVTLSWTAPDDGGSPIIEYGIDFTLAGTFTTIAVSRATTTHTVPGLTNGTEYTFSIHARNAIGRSFADVTATPATLPAAITNLTAVVGDRQVTLSWTAPDDGGSPLMAYDLGIALPDGTAVTPPTIPSATATTHTVTGLTNGTAYRFSLGARNAIGRRFARIDATPATLPAAITNLTAVAGDGEVTLSWTAPDDGGSPLTAYPLSIFSTSPLTFVLNDFVPSSATTHTVTGLTNGTEYQFALSARNAVGSSSSADVDATPVDTTKPVLTLNGNATVSLEFGSSYTEQGATATDNTDDNVVITGRIVIGGDTVDPSMAGTYTLTYNVSDSAANAADPLTRVVTVTATGPAAITNLTAVAGDTTVTLSWTPPADGGSPLTDYSLVILQDGRALAPSTLPSGATTHPVTGLTNGTAYEFLLSAGNAVGFSPDASIFATPLAPDTTKPVLTLNGNATVSLVRGGTYTEQGATATDNIDDNVVITGRIVIGGDSVDPTTLGTYTLTYNVSDSAANAADPLTRTVTVIAAAAATVPGLVPNLTAVAGDGEVTLSWTTPDDGGSPLTGYGLRVNPSAGGGGLGGVPQPSGDATTHTVSTFRLMNGTQYTFSIFARNAVGDSLSETTVTATPVADTTIPVITLNGLAAVNLGFGSSYTEQGATATDNVDDNVVITGRIVIGGDSVDTSMVGTYTITYNVSDSATTPNAAVEVTREVIVIATVPAAITNLTAVVGDTTVTLSWTAPVNDGGSPFAEYDLDVTLFSTGNTVLSDSVLRDATTHPVTGLTNGTAYNFTLVARNAVGPRLARVIATPLAPDTTKPVLTLNGNATVSLGFGSTYIDAGVTAQDNTDGDITSAITTTGLVNTTMVGTYTLTYNVSDSATNAADPLTRTVTVTAVAPAPVTNLTAVAGDTTVTLSWTAPVNDGGSPLTDYNINYTLAGTVTTLAVSRDATTRIVTGLTNGTAYDFALSARNAVGDSPAASVGATPAPGPADTTKPVITLTGPATVNLVLGSPYTEQGATATDDVDDNLVITGRIVIGGDTVDTSMVGTYRLTYNVSDSAAPTPNAAVEVTREVIVASATPRANAGADQSVAPGVNVTLSGSGTDVKDDAAGTPLSYAWTLTSGTPAPSLSNAATASASFTAATVTSTVTYVFTLTVTDSDGESASDTVTITVSAAPDTTIPVITLNGLATVNLVLGSPYNELNATALDNVDGDISANIVIGGDSVDTSMVGTYTITYNVSDSAPTPNAAVEVTREVIVTAADTTIPVITLTGPATVNLEVGGSYTEAGATASDNVDGDISANIVIGGDSVDTSMVGTYTITYNVSDSATTPNAAVEVTREVIVTAAATVPAAVTNLTAVAGDREVTLSWTAPDDGGSPLTDYSLVITRPDGTVFVPPTLPSATATTHTVTGLTNGTTYTFFLIAGNAVGAGPLATDTATPVAPPDTTIPVITLNGLATVNLEVGGTYTELNATASDNVDGDISANIVIGGDSVDTTTAGTYRITYNVSDSATTPNAAVEVTRVVIVAADTTIPVITLNGPATVNLEVGDTYTEAGATASDNVDGDISANIVIGGDSVDTTTAGTYRITYNVSDSDGNAAVEVTRVVTVASATPRANAGADQSVVPGANVILSGSGTDVKDDAARDPLTYLWTLTSGTPAPSLSNAATASASFTAATVTSTVTYVFTLTVTDSDGNPASDTVTITVNSEVAITRDIDKQNKLILPSIARAMADQNVNAISTRISQAGEANLKNSLGGKSNLVDILKSMERLNIDNSLNAEEALANSRFALALDGIEGAFWGKIDYQKFKGTDQGVKYDGDLFSSTVGVEGQINERTRLGLALSRNKSDIDYTDSAPVLAATSAGDYEIVLFSVNPYIAWKWTDRVDLWATFGYGQGELELTLANSSRVRSSDISQKTLAVGGSGVLLDNGAIELRLKGEAVKTRFEVDKSEGIAALELDAERLRLGLEGTHALSLEDGASLNSSVEVGVRYDGGDGQTGSSGEIGGGLEYSNGRGLSLQGNARVLVGGDNYDEWGLGGLLKFQPSTDGRGVSFNLGLGHGNTASKTQDIWKHTLANNSTATDNYTTTDINLGYGMTAPHWLGGSAYGILTPYTEVRLGNSNSYGLGLNWKLDPSVGLKLNFKHQSDSADSVNLEGEIHF